MIGASMDLSKMEKAFTNVLGRSKDWRKPFVAVGLLALKVFEHRFYVSGPGWPPNKKGTKTLIDTGRLMRSFAHVGNENLFQVGRVVATFGSRVPYANILQRGGTIKYKRPQLSFAQRLAGLQKLPATSYVIPPRPIVVAPDSDFKQKCGRIAYGHFVDGIQEAVR